MGAQTKRVSERRAERLLSEILVAQGWKLDRPPKGDLLLQQEYKAYPHLLEIFKSASKSGPGAGLPEAVLVDRESLEPLAVVEAKAKVEDFDKAVKKATEDYGLPCIREGYNTIAIALAGTSEDEFQLQVFKYTKSKWKPVTYDKNPINWIPNPEDIRSLGLPNGPTELRPTIPPPEVLADRADEINRLLRESRVKDEFRPATVAAIMLALWHSKGNIRREKEYILQDINDECAKAFLKTKNPELAHSLKVDEANDKLAVRTRRIASILVGLNITVLTAEHDYLGQLYETFFRYTGGNTIGQYFTPRHITELMADLCEVSPNDIILDPACGTGGFLIASMSRVLGVKKLSRTKLIKFVEKKLIGFESEPVTAALCVANMILRGDGSSGVFRGDCFTSDEFPVGKATVSLMNPPFPHKKTDTPAENFIDRALEGLQDRGMLATIVPYSFLLKSDKKTWRRNFLKNNSLLSVITLPPDLFVPYASSNTAILLAQKGVPHDNKNVYFARIVNDGFKVKKKLRVPTEGSQIHTLLELLKTKQEVPEFSVYSCVPDDSNEWSPEAYIEGRPPTEQDLIGGFEEFMRKHAAFYVHQGHRLIGKRETVHKGGVGSIPSIFSSESHLIYKSKENGVLGIKDYFKVSLGGKDEVEDLDDGDQPVITTSEFMNGVSAWKTPTQLYNHPAITIATDGSTCSSFVQEFPFYAFYKVAILYPLSGKNIPSDALYYIAFLTARERWRYVYARKFGKARILATNLFVPYENGEPDFEFMASLTRNTAGFPVIQAFRENLKSVDSHQPTRLGTDRFDKAVDALLATPPAPIKK